MPKNQHSLTIPDAVWTKATEKAETMGLSASAYVSMLIARDNQPINNQGGK